VCSRAGTDWPRAAALVALVALLSAGCGPEPPRLQAGDPAPPFALPALKGGEVSVPDDLRGQVVAVRFWADWCPFCETEMRDLEPVYLRHRDRGFRVLAVNVRQDRETAERFIRRLGVSYEVLLDGDGTAARAYGVIGLPTTVFIDRQGQVGPRILGESTPKVVEGILEGLL
jgi:peroxiredoxin